MQVKKMRFPTIFSNPGKILFWSCMAVLVFFGVLSLGAAYQEQNSETWFSIPSLWFFGLVVMPVLLYGLNRYYWAKRDRLRK